MHIVSLVGLRLPLEILLCFVPCSLLTEHFSISFCNIFVFATTQSCARGLCDTHLPDLNHSASQSKRSYCSRVSRDRRNRGVSGASSPSRFTTHFASFAPALLSCLPCFPASFPCVLFTTHLISSILLALSCFAFLPTLTVPLTLS